MLALANALLVVVDRLINRYLFTIVALIVVAYVVFGVEQVSHVMFQLPSFREGGTSVRIYLYGVMTAIAALYVYFFLTLEPGRLESPDETTHAWLGRKVYAVLEAPTRGIEWLLDWTWPRPDGENFLARNLGALFVAALAAIVAALRVAAPTWRDGLPTVEPAVLSSFAMLLAALAVWSILGGELGVAQQCSKPVWRTLGRAIWMLLLMNLVGEVIWYFAGSAPPWFTYRTYTVWAVMHMLFCLLLTARVSDAWQAESHKPIRLITLVLVVVAIVRMHPVTVGRELAETEAPPPAEITARWFETLERRLGDADTAGPYVFVAASGGGSRAAIYTALVLEALAQEPIEVGLRSYRFDQNVVLISCVSGGSLGSAYCATHGASETRDALMNSIRSELLRLTREETHALTAAIQRREGPLAGGARPLGDEELREGIRRMIPDDAWYFSRASIDDMSTDFMAPLLRGALHSGPARGESVQRFWQTRFGMDRINHAATGAGDDGPLLLINACEIDSGSRIVIGFPPLPPHCFADDSSEHKPHPLTALNPRWELSLSEAVRLSANFPWGFPVARVLRSPDSVAVAVGQEEAGYVHIVDGGVLDNTGVGTIRKLLEQLARWRDEPGSPAGRILEKLNRRGVILVEIDSGAKPAEPGWLARKLPTLFEPLMAMENAGYVNAENALTDHLVRIRQILPPADTMSDNRASATPDAGDDPPGDLLGQALVGRPDVTFQCNEQENVMTAWALGPQDKARILARFVVRAPDSIAELERLVKACHLRQIRAAADMARVAPTDRRRLDAEMEAMNRDARDARAAYRAQMILEKRIDQGRDMQHDPLAKAARQKLDTRSASARRADTEQRARAMSERLQRMPRKRPPPGP